MKISEIFEKILLKPEWYLATKSVIQLHIYIRGYIAALRDTNQPYDIEHFDSFCKWVEVRLNLNQTFSWADKVLYMAGHDEERSIELTKELWTLFNRE